jgi:protein TonB
MAPSPSEAGYIQLGQGAFSVTRRPSRGWAGIGRFPPIRLRRCAHFVRIDLNSSRVRPMNTPAVMNPKATLILAIALAGIVCSAFAEGQMESPVPVRTVPPTYPYEMRREGVSGLVNVNCMIDEKGDVQDPKVEKATNDKFIQPALDALKKWKFKPAKRDGTVVAIRVNIPIRFSVDN